MGILSARSSSIEMEITWVEYGLGLVIVALLLAPAAANTGLFAESGKGGGGGERSAQ